MIYNTHIHKIDAIIKRKECIFCLNTILKYECILQY